MIKRQCTYTVMTPRGHKWFFGYQIMPGGEGCNTKSST